MSDKNANDNDVPKAGADKPKADEKPQETAETPAENPEAEAENGEKSGWELGPEAQIEALATEAADLTVAVHSGRPQSSAGGVPDFFALSPDWADRGASDSHR